MKKKRNKKYTKIQTYDDFLKSKAWEKKKDALYSALKAIKQKNVCFFCESKAYKHVHHINYTDPLGEEELYNLLVLCKPCHADVHNYQKVNLCTIEEATLKYCELCKFDYKKYKSLLFNLTFTKKTLLTALEKQFMENVFSNLPALNAKEKIYS